MKTDESLRKLCRRNVHILMVGKFTNKLLTMKHFSTEFVQSRRRTLQNVQVELSCYDEGINEVKMPTQISRRPTDVQPETFANK